MKILSTFTAVIIIAFLYPQDAEAAYIDPNTGGMLFQAFAAGFAAISGLILIFSSRIRMTVNRYRRRRRESHAEQEYRSDDVSID